MELIRVPGPPPQAFNRNRRLSDLIKAQVDHFKHLEEKLPEAQRSNIGRHEIVSESDAAKYIAHMTSVLLGNASIPAMTAVKPSRKAVRAPIPIRPGQSLAIAASTETRSVKKHSTVKSSKKENAPRTSKRKK